MDDYSIYCPYCHKHTALFIPPAVDSITGDISRRTLCRVDDREGTMWTMGICNSCENVILIHETTNGSEQQVTYYPTPLPGPIDIRLPDFIKTDLQEAKICFSQNAFNATAMLCRRLIGLICMDKKADPKLDLYRQIDWMLANHIITEDMSRWAHTVRLVGNDVAHPQSLQDDAVQMDDAREILELADQMAITLYVTPAIAQAQRKKRDDKVNQKKTKD